MYDYVYFLLMNTGRFIEIRVEENDEKAEKREEKKRFQANC